MGEGGFAKRWRYSISLFSKMGDKGEGGVKNLKKSVTLFMDGPFTIFRTRPSTIILNEWKVLKLLINAHFNYYCDCATSNICIVYCTFIHFTCLHIILLFYVVLRMYLSTYALRVGNGKIVEYVPLNESM